MKKILSVLPILALLACQTGKESPKESMVVKDPHSYSRPEEARVKHLDLELAVSFKQKQISGKASWEIENSAGADVIIFDTRGLTISKVTADGEDTNFGTGEEQKFLGRPLRINIKPDTKNVTIWYTTAQDAAALQWLEPQQTAGKKHPFLFTQSQAILARTWIPCQDSPSIRFTYHATITVPHNLMAVMSAVNPTGKNARGVYQFKQPKAIPSYLMALAVGDLVFNKVGNRTGVYAEPVTVKRAAWEFADMEKMVEAAEKLYGPYQWERYDVLVLPPSFPFGGMENPMLTFATPTVIAGDRSLVSLIAHELAHSWSGNLVTNATWNDFWLNEGFTNYFERRILEAVYGKDYAQMQELLGRQDLIRALEEYGPENPDTRLKADFAGRDPDEGVSDIAYEKGYSFLRTVEEAVGRKRFDSFIKNYFDAHAFQSVTTEQFLSYLNENLIGDNKALSDSINANAWVFEPGIPTNIPPVESVRFNRVDTLLNNWIKTGDTAAWKASEYSTSELLYLIRKLPADMNSSRLTQLDETFKLTESRNAEIQTAWYTVAIRQNYRKAYPHIEKFLAEVGRRKFLMPLYEEMLKQPGGRKWAKEIYAKARPNYHSVAYNSLDKLLK
jgi:leukotriene-A4 hydrolase